jgi:hypothetical protein
MQEPVQAAQDGDIAAQYEVGVRIVNGDGVWDPPNYALASSYFRRAAERGHAGAQAELGMLYHGGHGVPHNDVDAYTWLTLAMRQQPADASAYALWRDVVARDMTPEAIGAAETAAREWRPPR